MSDIKAATVLTDERIGELWHAAGCKVSVDTKAMKFEFARAIEREVLAHASKAVVAEVPAAAGIEGLARYDIEHDGCGWMREYIKGDYVKFADVERLLAHAGVTAELAAWRALNDVEWMNIVNHDHAYRSFTKDEAVHEAVKRTEAKLREINAAPTIPAQVPVAEVRAATLEPERMSTDESREYLVKFMEQHFTDRTFHRYIRGDTTRASILAGDFAWQMARALRMILAQSSTADKACEVRAAEVQAARYRFLRSQMAFDKPAGQPVTMALRTPIYAPDHDVHKDWYSERFDASVDATVDRAMAAAPSTADSGSTLKGSSDE